MQEVFTRIAKWNQARYEQEFNQELTLKLLREEYREWIEADTLIDKVHELCDVMYVAMGAMWKLKEELSPEVSAVCFEVTDNTATEFIFPGTLIPTAIDSLELQTDITVQEKLSCLFNVTLFTQAQLLDYGLDYEQIIECMLVVCDSNDSKTIKKTASNVKANSNDKGAYYKSPIPGITAIVEQIKYDS